MTLLTAGLMTIQGVGMALAGVAAEFAGVRGAVVGAGALGTVCCALLAVEARRTAVGPPGDRWGTAGGPLGDGRGTVGGPKDETGLTTM